MIHVKRLTKYYGDYAAVRDVSFDVERGQVVGFLGPNGAGKSTTMRVLAGYLTATSGQATIDGLDVFWKPVEVRRRIGYMPESCPLYPEMRVGEYLRFRAGVKGLHGREQTRRVDYVLKRCWLGDVGRQLVGTLSKGYRQRVGLADALLADPPVLILDEPTSGLDPSQIRETRGLIRELGKQHTVLLSTHILPEVEMTCDHAIIINRGEVAEAGPIKELARRAGTKGALVATIEGDFQKQVLSRLPGARRVQGEREGDVTRLVITVDDPEEAVPAFCRLAHEMSWKVREARPQRQTLEDLFVGIVAGEDGKAAEMTNDQ